MPPSESLHPLRCLRLEVAYNWYSVSVSREFQRRQQVAQRKSNVYGGSDRLRRPSLGTPPDFRWAGGLPGGTSNPGPDRCLVGGDPGPLTPGAAVMLGSSNEAANRQSNRFFDSSADVP